MNPTALEDEDPVEFHEETPEGIPAFPPGPIPGIPTVDMDEPVEVPYLDYDPEKTKVVSGPLAGAQFPGRRFNNKREARKFWHDRAGKIIEDLSVKGRWIFRVRRDA
jgi:hypothetical protein